jgi:hypothetical protein
MTFYKIIIFIFTNAGASDFTITEETTISYDLEPVSPTSLLLHSPGN